MNESDFSSVRETEPSLTAQSAPAPQEHMKQPSFRQTLSQTGQPVKGQVIYQNAPRKQTAFEQNPGSRTRADAAASDKSCAEPLSALENRFSPGRTEAGCPQREERETNPLSSGSRQPENCGGGLRAGEQAFRAATPYPPVRAGCKNPRYASAILDNLGGQLSEMTAVGQYFYSELLSDSCREVAAAFRQVSIVEMHHMKIFARLAMQLGRDPRLWSRNFRTGRYLYWNAGYLTYCSSLKDLLSAAITSEREACSKYLKQASWIQDANVCDNLKRIAADEQMHAELFTRLFHRYC